MLHIYLRAVFIISYCKRMGIDENSYGNMTLCCRCDYGYYGNPSQPGGSCVPCNCDPFGSVHEGCDNQGQCTCKEGITGRDCSQCAPRHVTSASGCICMCWLSLCQLNVNCHKNTCLYPHYSVNILDVSHLEINK